MHVDELENPTGRMFFACAVTALLGVAIGLALQPVGVGASVLGGGLAAALLGAYALLLPAWRAAASHATVHPAVLLDGLRELGRAVADRTGADPLDPEDGAAGTGCRTEVFALHGVRTPGGPLVQLTFAGEALRVTFDGATGSCTTSRELDDADWSARLRACHSSLPPRLAAPAPLLPAPLLPAPLLPAPRTGATVTRVA